MLKKKIRTIVVDDSKFIRTLFTGLLNQTSDIEVVDTSNDAHDASEKIKKHNPDIITIDIGMPRMDGINFLETVLKSKPLPVLMISNLNKEDADNTLRALELGAIDYLAKPNDFNIYRNLDLLKNNLAEKIRHAVGAKVLSQQPLHNKLKVVNYTANHTTSNKVIAIGASTGGIEAIKKIVCRLPFNCPPVLVTQHISDTFTEAFARRLNSMAQVEVQIAREGQKLQFGNVYIAPGNKNILIEKTKSDIKIKLQDLPDNNNGISSIDAMFNSVVTACHKNAIGVILTGSGTDGAQGIKKLKDSGAHTIGQAPETCVVSELPEAARKLGGLSITKSIDDIAEEIIKNCTR